MLGSPFASEVWTEADADLAHASEIYETFDRCPCGCGGFADETLTADGRHGVERLRCDARAAMQADAKENKDLDPGVFSFPVLDGQPRQRVTLADLSPKSGRPATQS